MKKYGHELIFISKIKLDGSGVIDLEEREPLFDNELFTLTILSITLETYIATCLHSYLVKLKPKSPQKSEDYLLAY